jgi:hypothetical protein
VATHAWYTNFTDDYPAYPKNVYYSSEGADPEDPATKLVESFVSKLSGFLNTNYTVANISEQWAASRPANVTSSIDELLNETYAILTSNDQFNLLGKPFFEDYATQHDGRRPFGKSHIQITLPCDQRSMLTISQYVPPPSPTSLPTIHGQTPSIETDLHVRANASISPRSEGPIPHHPHLT